MEHSAPIRPGRTNLPVAGDGLEGTVVAAEGDVETNNSLASLDEVEVLLIDASLGSGVLIEELDLLEETWLVVLIELGAELLASGGEVSESYKSKKRSGVSILTASAVYLLG